MWNIKQKLPNRTNKNKLKDSGYQGRKGVKKGQRVGKGGQVYGNGRKLDFCS